MNKSDDKKVGLYSLLVTTKKGALMLAVSNRHKDGVKCPAKFFTIPPNFKTL